MGTPRPTCEMDFVCWFSQSQENFSFVEELDEPEGQKQADDGNDHFAQTADAVVEKGFCVATDKALGQEAEGSAESIFGEVDGDGIHSHPDEGLAPTAKLQDIDDPKEYAQKNRAVTAGNEDEG